jgi:tetratricopeptide (TPR) repeat protein
LPPRQAKERLEKFQLGQPEIYQVRIELVRSLYRLWQEQVEVDQQAAQDVWIELDRANRELQADPRIGGKSKLRSTLWVIDAMLQSKVAQAELEVVLDKAVELAAFPGTPVEMIYLLTYYRMTSARQAGKQEAGIELARQLAAKAVDTPFERSALLYLAESYPASGELDPERRSIAMADLLRLVELLGTDTGSLAQSNNAQVALFRLTELYIQDRQWERADRHLENLVKAFPQRREYRAATARVKTERGHFQQALPHWRFLAQRVEPGTDLWYEAKYQLIRCLWSADDDSAKAVLRQTMQLSPSMPDGWAGQYARLAEEIGWGE